MAVNALLSKTCVMDTPDTGPVITLSASERTYEAYSTLAENNIRSAPVWDDRENKFIGFLDVRDLIQIIVFEQKQANVSKAAAFAGTADRLKYLERLVKVGGRMYEQPGDGVTLSYLARRHPFHSVNEKATLADVANMLVKTRCHRVPVCNDKGEVVRVISQSTLVKYLYDHRAELGAVGETTVEAMKCGTSPVLAVKTTDTILHAFELMASKDIMGVAIVDDEGHLVANTSASDFKEFIRDPSTSLQLTAIDFISKVRQHDLKAVHPAISVHSEDTLTHVIGKLAATKVHRIFVVDGGKLRSVMSLTDILRYTFSQ